MIEHAHPLLVRGRFKVVALTAGEAYEPDDVVAFAVTTRSGAELKRVLTLDAAKSWMDQLHERESHDDELRPDQAPPSPLNRKRTRRQAR